MHQIHLPNERVPILDYMHIEFKTQTLRLLDTYAAKNHAKNRPRLHVSLDNSAARPSLKDLYDAL